MNGAAVAGAVTAVLCLFVGLPLAVVLLAAWWAQGGRRR